MSMTAIIDYGVGNLFSLCSSLKSIGAEAIVTPDADTIRAADRIILPGVGAFADAAAKLRATGLDKVLLEEAQKGKPIMGICLGMQMLFETSLEYGEHKGLGLIPGRVVPMAGYIPEGLKIPHIGWNALQKTGNSRLLSGVAEGDFVYFVHSFHAQGCEYSLVAVTEYGMTVTAAVQKENVMGCQFHPEKSGQVGLAILKAFAEAQL